jgi:myo-inositol-1(or 4)-monophosphatase
MSSIPSGVNLDAARTAAREAATAAGNLIARRLGERHVVDEMHAHDIKLAVDRESQELITEILLGAFPDHGILGEEGVAGDPASDYQWIVDPIDGTVNFFYGIPHFGVSVALRRKQQVIAGVICDPMMGEVWEVDATGDPTLNGTPVGVSARDRLSETIVAMGFAKRSGALEHGVRRYERVAPAVKKIRMLGSAALEMAYVASGRLDAYIEEQVSIWDIAAGRLLVERAGGSVTLTPHANRDDRFSIVCTNGLIPIEDLLS